MRLLEVPAPFGDDSPKSATGRHAITNSKHGRQMVNDGIFSSVAAFRCRCTRSLSCSNQKVGRSFAAGVLPNAAPARGRLVRVRYLPSAESSVVDAERERIVRTVRGQSPWQDFRPIDDRPCPERMPLTRDTSTDRCGHMRAIWVGRRPLV